jgi:endonuclease/exonuclease/phosphatase family metal-dependent hydrolase
MHMRSSFFAFAVLAGSLAAACSDAPLLSAGTTGASSASGSGGSASGTSEAGGPTSASASTSASTSSGAGGSGGGATGFGVLSLNLHCFKLDGTSFATNDARFASIAALVAGEGVGVLLLQEACERPGEKAVDLLRAAVEKSTGATWAGAWAFAHLAWQGTPDESNEGVAVLTRGALSAPEELEYAVQATLRRVALSATLPGALGSLRVTTVHFDVFDAAARRMQGRETAAAALVGSDPGFGAIVGGDFNDVEGSDAHVAFKAMGFLDASAGLEAGGIDHVLIHRAAPFRPSSAKLVFTGAEAVSDHPGVLVRFEPAKGDAVTTTRIEVAATPGAGHFIAVRGSAAPLSWMIGWPMRQAKPSTWRFATTEQSGSFAFKLLVDDTQWQLGADVAGTAGQDHAVTPMF